MLLCLVQVIAWSHPTTAMAMNHDAGADAMSAIREQYESTVANFRGGNMDSLEERTTVQSAAFDGAGREAPVPWPDPGVRHKPSPGATAGDALNSRRSEASVRDMDPSNPARHRRLAMVGGSSKKNGKKAGADGGGASTLFALLTLAGAGLAVGGVVLAGRSASVLLGARAGVRATYSRIPLQGAALRAQRQPLRPLLSAVPSYNSTLQMDRPFDAHPASTAAPSAAPSTDSIEVVPHATTAWDWVLHPTEVAAALSYKLGGGFNGGGNVAGLLDNSEDAQFCDDMLQKTSRSFAAVIQQLPPDLRPGVCVFYLILRALDTIEDDMTVALPPKIALLQSFHEQMQESEMVVRGYGFDDEKDLLEQLPRLLRVFKSLPEPQQQVITDITRRMGEGMASFAGADLTEGTTTMDDYNLYCHYVAGLVGEGLSSLFARSGLEDASLESQLDLANDMGLFLQKTNIIRDFLEDYVDGRTWWPREIWGNYVAHMWELADEGKRQEATACLNHMVTDALELVPSCIAYLDQLEDEAVMRFCLIPQLMAIATQAACFNNPHVFSGIVKIRPGLSAKLILSTKQDPSAQNARTWFAHFGAQIKANVDPADPNAERTMRALEALEECCRAEPAAPGSRV